MASRCKLVSDCGSLWVVVVYLCLVKSEGFTFRRKMAASTAIVRVSWLCVFFLCCKFVSFTRTYRDIFVI